MTTDRPAVPTRGIAIADRTAHRGVTQAPPSDAFSALLGAAAPKNDAPARRDERPANRDERPANRDEPRRGDIPPERRSHVAKRDEHRRPDTAGTEGAPAGEAIDTSCEPDAPPETPAAPTTPSLFALQLASPLPPAAVTPAVAPPAATATPPESAPVLPILSTIVPASVAVAPAPAAAIAGTAVAGEVAAAPAVPAAPAVVAESAVPAAVAATSSPAVLADASTVAAPADGEIAVPEHLLKPQTPAAAQPAVAQDAASTAQPQTGADSETPGQPHTPSPAPAATATAAPAAAQPKADGPAETAAPAPAPAAQPATPTPTAAPTASNGLPNVERAVPLSRAVATTGVLIHLASERGVTHARLNLKPVELGGIEVKLHSTPAGIHAQLVAESPEAARMLSQAGEDLKRQLEDRNVNLLSLDVSTSGDQRNDEPRFADGFDDDHRPGGHLSASRGTREDTVLMESPVAADTVLVLPDGVHVDVLA